ncbi:hypothetical protein BOX15_Mlig019125g1 [Macrostomum lignano]|uniref:Diacylglycerol kinase n=1 Tax=Macrostomum lignano TaxID=282301 RepID=A0A267EM52_9PLAT|nr:hypothetical protein BOX15_Mlig019125g1 [Macrostomum lignano]
MSHEYDLVWEPQDTAPPSGHGANMDCFGGASAGGNGGGGGVGSSGVGGSGGGPEDGMGGIDPESGHKHSFIKRTFHRPTYCHHCAEMLWGLLSQGFTCSLCSFTVHDRCLKSVLSPCTCIAPNMVLRPVSHCWSEPAHFKRKFCNVCRKRLDYYPAVRCEICEYYCHLECQDFVTNDCKECATYGPESQQLGPAHHWREGNLPGNSKCAVCKRTCWSSECLSGYRCEWCGLTAHAGCHRALPAECSFGILGEIVLRPSAVTLPRTDIPLDKIYGLQRRNTSRTISEDWSSSGGDSTRDEAAAVANQASGYQDRRSPKDRQEVNEDLVKIYDGNGAAQRKQYRIVSIQRGTTLAQLTECALRVYHVLDDARLYTLVELNERDGSERRLDESAPLKQQFRFDSRRPAVVLRYREKDANRASIRVYPTGLQYFARVPTNFKYVTVTKETTAQETIVYALKKFGVEQLDASQLDLVEVSLDKQVSERTLARDEKPLQLLHSVRRESVRQYMLTRFYMQPVIDPRYTGLALYVGNLKTGMSQRVYEKILMEKLGSENKWDSIDVIYYEYGAMVLVYKNPRRLQQAYNSLRDQWFDDKPMLVLLLPQLHPEMIPDGTTPVLVLVNVKSGGCQGIELITAFRKLLNPHQVFNLDYGGPLPGLYVFRQVSYYKILVCGGDGTVGWALSCLDNVGPDAKCNYPPMAIVPLGTGNDLSRVLRWGSGYSGQEYPLNILRDVAEAEVVTLDRWTVIFHPEEKEKDETKVQLQYESNAANTNEDNASIFVMNNYFGIGLDADVSLDFHLARNENPSKFNSRFHNKGVYFKMSVRKMMSKGSCKDLHRQIIVEVDGKVIDLPPLEGIIILNILSWASGANPWGTEKDDNFNRPNHWDGQLEVVGVTGMVHMGQIFSGLRSGNRIAQGGHIKITLKGDIPVQIDGEPWVQSSGQVVVLRSALRASMLKKCKGKSKGRGALAEPSFYNLEPSQCPTPPPDEGATGGSD